MSQLTSIEFNLKRGKFYPAALVIKMAQDKLVDAGFEVIADEMRSKAKRAKTPEKLLEVIGGFVRNGSINPAFVKMGLKEYADAVRNGAPAPEDDAKEPIYLSIKTGSVKALDALIAGEALNETDKIKALARYRHEKGHWDKSARSIKPKEIVEMLGEITPEIAMGIAQFLGVVEYDFQEIIKPAEICKYGEEAAIVLAKSSRKRQDILKHIPQSNKVCLAAVEANPWCFNDVKPEFICYDMAMIACSAFGNFLGRVPKKLHDEELIIEAVSQCGTAIQDAAFQTERICMAAVTRGELGRMNSLKYKTEAICFEALKNSGWALEDIENPTEAMCELAVKTDPNWRILKHVPRITISMVKAICDDYDENWKRKDIDISRGVKPSKMTPEVLAYIMKRGWGPKTMKLSTKNPIVLEVLKLNGLLLEMFKPNERNLDMCTAAVTSNPNAIEFVPKKFH